MSQEMIKLETESGQTMTEYAVVLGVITIAIVTTFTLLSGSINSAFQRTLEIIRFAVT